MEEFQAAGCCLHMDAAALGMAVPEDE